jgi:hypothetical protein
LDDAEHGQSPSWTTGVAPELFDSTHAATNAYQNGARFEGAGYRAAHRQSKIADLLCCCMREMFDLKSR